MVVGMQPALRSTHTMPPTLQRGTQKHHAVDGIPCRNPWNVAMVRVRMSDALKGMLAPFYQRLWIRATWTPSSRTLVLSPTPLPTARRMPVRVKSWTRLVGRVSLRAHNADASFHCSIRRAQAKCQQRNATHVSFVPTPTSNSERQRGCGPQPNSPIPTTTRPSRWRTFHILRWSTPTSVPILSHHRKCNPHSYIPNDTGSTPAASFLHGSSLLV